MSKKGDVYRKAAELLAEDYDGIEYSCHAVARAAGSPSCPITGPALSAYDAMFRPEGSTFHSWLYNDCSLPDRNAPSAYETFKEWRLTALCLAAAMADAGDL